MMESNILPRLIAFEITHKCRFNCRHCRANASSQHLNHELTTSQCKKIIHSIADYAKCTLILTGGEPMERPDIYELISFCRDLELKPAMAACGYLMNENSAEKLKQSGLLALSLSIDGASAQTHDAFRQAEGAYDAAINAARIAKGAKLPFQINTTVTRSNLDEVFAIAKIAQELGAVCFNPFVLVPTGRAVKMESEILDPVEYEMLLNRLLELKKTSKIEVRVTCAPAFARVVKQSNAEQRIGAVNGCMGGSGFGFISYKGDVQTCGFLNISAGNMLEHNYNFKQIWENSAFLNQLRDRSNLRGRCGDCEFVDACGGCRARAFAICGDYLGSDPVCKNAAKAAEVKK